MGREAAPRKYVPRGDVVIGRRRCEKLSQKYLNLKIADLGDVRYLFALDFFYFFFVSSQPTACSCGSRRRRKDASPQIRCQSTRQSKMRSGREFSFILHRLHDPISIKDKLRRVGNSTSNIKKLSPAPFDQRALQRKATLHRFLERKYW